MDGIITRTGYIPTTLLIYRKAAFLNLANVLLVKVAVVLVEVAAAAVTVMKTALSLNKRARIYTERLVVSVLSSGTALHCRMCQ